MEQMFFDAYLENSIKFRWVVFMDFCAEAYPVKVLQTLFICAIKIKNCPCLENYALRTRVIFWRFAPVKGGSGVPTPASSGPGGQMSKSEIWATGLKKFALPP